MEVTHSCYAPPGKDYPTCDDGGYWLYGTSGSGVFWKSSGESTTSSGLCLIANNKIDALFKLWNYAKSQKSDALKLALLETGLPPTATAEEYLVARLKNTGGGMKLMPALKEVIKASSKGKQIPSITAWRTMEPSNSKTAWFKWISTSLILFLLLLTFIGGFFYNIYISIKDRKDKKWWVSTLISLGIITGILVCSILFYWIEWSLASENMFESFGYTTLDMALSKSGLSLTNFVFASAGIDRNYKNSARGNYNPIANGLAQTQLFDFDLSYMTSILNIDSIIMHTQPNKSGSWSVEILDVRNTPAKNSKSLDDLIFTLGLCGQPIDPKIPSKMPVLMRGPIKKDDSVYFNYTPTTICNCSDKTIAGIYNKGKGPLKKCVYCTGTLSDTMC